MDEAASDSLVSLNEGLRRAIPKLPTPVRLRAENALDGFERAVALLPIDREMASFRAITAEEEAATALFRALQLRSYPGAETLNLGNHRHKAALGPFIQAVKVALFSGRELTLRVTIRWAEPSLVISIPLSTLGIAFKGSEALQITLAEPLGIVGRKGDQHPVDFFQEPMERVTAAANSGSIAKLIAKEANARNRLLYASDTARPQSQATAETIATRRQRAEIALFLCIAVLQTQTHQPLANQCLAAFLSLVGKPPEQLPQFDEPPAEVTINVKNEGPSEVLFESG